nr:endonuclease/exonuclease/phosphatase family protein [Modestobacter muralis]
MVTFNVHHGVGLDGRHDLDRLTRLLAATDAEVLCLQEVDRHFGARSEHADQVQALAGALGLELAFAASLDEPADGPGRRQYGNALLSRLPLLDARVHRLPGTGEPRTALRAVVQTDGGALAVTTTHLANRSRADRAAQATVLAELAGSDGVVVGDLNADARAPELAPLRARLTDAWTAAPDRGDQSRRLSLHRGQGCTHPVRRPRVRIDQVWVPPGVTVTAARVLDGSAVSDHHPFQVDLSVTPR